MIPNNFFQEDSEKYKKSTVLVIGDHKCGKTTFLKRFCSEIHDKKLNKSSSKINIHLKRQLIERTRDMNNEPRFLKYTIEFIELSGEKNYKDAMAFYVSQLLAVCSAIFFFFDVTNKKSLFNFYMWIKFLVEAWDETKGENPLWTKPFLLLGAKRNLINDLETLKWEINEYVKDLFDNENVIFLQKQPKKIDLNELFLQSFLKQICIDSELQRLQKGEIAEDLLLESDLSLMQHDLKRYCMKKEVLFKNLLLNTIARETMANLYWQFINYLWGYYKQFKFFWNFTYKVKKEIRKIN